MLEDALWETAYSGYNHEDYYAIAHSANASPAVFANMMRCVGREVHFYPGNLDIDQTFRPLTEPFLKDISRTGRFYANAVQVDDYMSDSTSIPTVDFSVFANLDFVNAMENSFEESKDFVNFYNVFQNTALRIPTNFAPVQSYIQVLNNFRSDFEEFGPNLDNSLLESEADKDMFTPTNDSNGGMENSRFTSPLRMRYTARNSIVTFNAMQKVFRARYDEGRSNTSLGQLAELDSKQPFITANRPAYEKMLGKNKESFYSTTTYKSVPLDFVNDLQSLNSSLNYYFFELPFLAGIERDVSRYY
jgi:hypothetical protein